MHLIFTSQITAFVVILFCMSGNLLAQPIVIDAIEISATPQTGESKLPSYTSFIDATRNPALFRTQNISEISRTNTTRKTGFKIDFIFSSVQNGQHQFIAGFEAASFDTDLYEISGSFQDSLSASTSINAKNEFFFLKGGYNYVRTPKRRFTLMAGALINFGIPVSSKTDEVISVSESFFDETRYSFFAKQSASFGLTIPVGVRVKMFKNVSLSFITNPGFQYYRVDGTSLLTVFQGANFSFHFRLRED